MSNYTFYNRLKMLSDYYDKSINEVEKDLNYPRNALHNYKGKRLPSGTRLIELSRYFNVSPEYLIGMSHNRELKESSNTRELKKLIKRMKTEILKLESLLNK